MRRFGFYVNSNTLIQSQLTVTTVSEDGRRSGFVFTFRREFEEVVVLTKGLKVGLGLSRPGDGQLVSQAFRRKRGDETKDEKKKKKKNVKPPKAGKLKKGERGVMSGKVVDVKGDATAVSSLTKTLALRGGERGEREWSGGSSTKENGEGGTSPENRLSPLKQKSDMSMGRMSEKDVFRNKQRQLSELQGRNEQGVMLNEEEVEVMEAEQAAKVGDGMLLWNVSDEEGKFSM